ncbi:MAG: PD-(D/E)XK nuclease family protein [bacterium]|nr:PD-(D/E)XK nuclease family protein [bacterium]
MSGIVLTPSLVESYLRCPWMTYLINNCGLKLRPVFQNELGQACHAFVAGLHKPKNYEGKIIKSLGPRFVRETLDEEWRNFWYHWLKNMKGIPLDRRSFSNFLNWGLGKGVQYIEFYLRHPRVMEIDPDKIEVRLPRMHIPDTSVDLEARVDQIRNSGNNQEVLVDLKFSEENHFDPNTNLALKCYSLLYQMRGREPEAKVCIWNVPFGRSGLKTTTYDASVRIETTNILRKTGLAIINRKFNVKGPHMTCESCSKDEVCFNPSNSVKLSELAYRNTNCRVPLPVSRSEIIRERILEVPLNKPIANPDNQINLDFDLMEKNLIL